jgi:raffinose/stachyose/melibiose transport system substrate-binding protein
MYFKIFLRSLYGGEKMKLSKKLLVLALVAFFVTGNIFANGSKESATNSEVELKVFDYIDATAPGYADNKAIWQDFSDNNSDITIVKEELSNEAFHQKISAYIAAGTMPDVMYMYPSGRSTLIHEMKLTKDLAPLLGEDFLSHFVPAAIDPSSQTGGYLAELPQSITYSSIMYVNTKLLSDLGLAIPKTYADLKAMVPTLKSKGIQTVLMANKDSWVMQSCLFSTIVGRFMNNDWITNVKTGDAQFTDAGFIEALNFVKTMYKDGVISPNTIQISYGEAPALFAAGKAAFYIDGDWRQNAFITDPASGTALISPEAQKNDFAFMNFPAIPGEKNPGAASTILGCGYGISSAIPAGSEKEAAAVKLIKYLYSVDVQKQYLEMGRYITSRNDVTSDALEPFIPKMMQYYDSIDTTCYVLDGVLNSSVCTVLNNGLQEIGLGMKTPKQVASEIQESMDSELTTDK